MAMDANLPELRHLRCFAAVASCGSFKAAAQQLGMAQPALSQQIQRLEAQLGYPLFDRGRSGAARLALTEAGRTLLTPARRLLRTAQDAMHSARSSGAGRTGLLRIGFVSSCAASVLAPLLRRYRGEFPAIKLDLIEMTTMQQADALLGGAVDVCLGRDVEGFGDAYESLCIARDTIMVLLPHDHRLAGKAVLPMAGLSQEDFVLFPAARGTAFYQRMIAPCLRAGFMPRVVQEATEWLTLMGLVEAGLGISLIPHRMTAHAPPGCVAAPTGDQQADTSIYLWWAAGDAHAAVGHFRAMAASGTRPPRACL